MCVEEIKPQNLLIYKTVPFLWDTNNAFMLDKQGYRENIIIIIIIIIIVAVICFAE